MSGETTVPAETTASLLGSPEADRLVRALAELGSGAPTFVLVGGLAVMARLANVHRATQDIDAVTGVEDFVQVTVDRVASANGDGPFLTVGGVRVDTIEVDPQTQWAQIASIDDPIQRLYVAGHLWAYGDAAPMRLATDAARVRVPVATARALLVAKMHAYLSPRRNPAKRSSDALDVFRLGEVVARADETPGLADEAVPPVVAEATRWGLSQIAARPSDMLRGLRAVGTPADEVSEPVVVALAELLCDDLASSRPSKR